MTGHWQQHHLIPHALARSGRYRDIAEMLDAAARVRPDLIAATMALPGAAHVALSTGLPLHRGPHPAYDDWVAWRLSQALPVARTTGAPPIGLIAGMQAGFRAVLASGQWGRRVADRSPMGCRPGIEAVDGLIDRLGDRLYADPTGQTSR
jgi:hypothetical protein